MSVRLRTSFWSRECRDLCNEAAKRDSYEVNWLGADCLDQLGNRNGCIIKGIVFSDTR